MNGKIAKYVAYGISAVVLLTGSFFLFAALSGTPISDMKGVGDAFPDDDTGPATASKDLPHPQDELDDDRRSTEQILGDSTTPLRAFSLPSGFSAAELGELEQSLERRLEEVERRDRDLDERERQHEVDRRLYDELFAELETLRSSLLDQESEQDAQAEELNAKRAAVEASRRASFAKLAPFYEDAEPEDAAAMLIEYGPEDAALILVAVSKKRAAELVTAVFSINPDTSKALQDAYMAANSPAPPAQ